MPPHLNNQMANMNLGPQKPVGPPGIGGPMSRPMGPPGGPMTPSVRPMGPPGSNPRPMGPPGLLENIKDLLCDYLKLK